MANTSKLAADLIVFGFQLGGSRRMAEKYGDLIPITEKTDWDLYCADSSANRAHLTSLGFYRVKANNKQYWDNLLVDIYKHHEHDIEVLIRKDCVIYSRAFESISAETYRFRLWKSYPGLEVENLQAFRAGVCAYFNSLFTQFGYQEKIELGGIDLTDEIPF